MKLFETSHLQVELKEEPVKHLVTTWIGYSSKEDFLKGIDTILKLLNEHKVKHIVNDIRQQQVVGTDAQQEAAEKVMNHVKKHGAFKQAMIVSQDVFMKFGSKNFDKQVKGQVRDEINRFFDSVEEGENWLKTQQV